MRLRHLAILAALTSAVPARAEDPPSPPVPGPLRPLPPPDASPVPDRRPQAVREPAAPPRAVRAWSGRLVPSTPDELVRGLVRFDVATHQVRIENFAITDGPNLEFALIAADRADTTAAVLAAKRVSLGRLRRIRPTMVLRWPAEIDLTIYRTLVVWSRRDRAPRGYARLTPDRTS